MSHLLKAMYRQTLALLTFPVLLENCVSTLQEQLSKDVCLCLNIGMCVHH